VEVFLASVAANGLSTGCPSVTYLASTKRIAEILSHPELGDDERVPLPEHREHVRRGILELLRRNHIIEPMDVSIIELEVPKVVLPLLPLADCGRTAVLDQIPMRDGTDAADVVDGEEVGMHRGDEEARVMRRSGRNVAHPQEDVYPYLEANGTRRLERIWLLLLLLLAALSIRGWVREFHYAADHVWIPRSGGPGGREIDVIIDVDNPLVA